MDVERDTAIVNPNSDVGLIAGPSRSLHHPSVSGVSSDLQAMNLTESGDSPNPRNAICPPPQPPKSEIAAPPFLLLLEEEREREAEKVISEIIESILEAQRKGYEVPSDEDDDPGIRWRKERGLSVPADYAWTDPPESPEYDSDDWKYTPVIPYIAPDVLECDICGRLHSETCCPYWFEFPPGGELRNTSDYVIVCDECGLEAVDGHCPDEKLHPNSTKRVVSSHMAEYTYDDSMSDDSP